MSKLPYILSALMKLYSWLAAVVAGLPCDFRIAPTSCVSFLPSQTYGKVGESLQRHFNALTRINALFLLYCAVSKSSLAQPQEDVFTTMRAVPENRAANLRGPAAGFPVDRTCSSVCNIVRKTESRLSRDGNMDILEGAKGRMLRKDW